MTSHDTNPAPENNPVAANVGGNPKRHRFALPWLSIQSRQGRITSRPAALNDQRPNLKSTRRAEASQQGGPNLKLAKNMIIESGPVGEARIDDQS